MCKTFLINYKLLMCECIKFSTFPIIVYINRVDINLTLEF